MKSQYSNPILFIENSKKNKIYSIYRYIRSMLRHIHYRPLLRSLPYHIPPFMTSLIKGIRSIIMYIKIIMMVTFSNIIHSYSFIHTLI